MSTIAILMALFIQAGAIIWLLFLVERLRNNVRFLLTELDMDRIHHSDRLAVVHELMGKLSQRLNDLEMERRERLQAIWRERQAEERRQEERDARVIFRAGREP